MSAKKRKDLVKERLLEDIPQCILPCILLCISFDSLLFVAFGSRKELAKQNKDYEKLQKQAGEAGIEPRPAIIDHLTVLGSVPVEDAERR